jgi:2-polyprenyl-6-methoxyphenol hydroxylase-like FAD-dependent oxidoreductase
MRDPNGLRSSDASSERLDAVVVGGGPAGCLAAIGLARQGLRVAIVDRGPRGRDKCCGHCLNPRVAPILARHGLLGAIDSIAVGRTRQLALESRAGGPLIDLRLDASARHGGWLVPRDQLDALLWDEAVAAGAIGVRPAAASLISVEEPSMGGDAVLELEEAGTRRGLRCGLVVAADGLGSGLARRAGLAPRRSGRGFGFSASIEPASAVADALRLRADRVLMLVDSQGYLGLVREVDSCGRERVHAAGLVRDGGAERRSPQAFVQAMLESRVPIEATLHGLVAAGPMPWRPSQVTRRTLALVGDAAGYVEPFTGEGMAWAFESADALLEAVAVHRGWNEAAASTYARLHRERIGSAQRGCTLVAAALARPRLLHAACAIGRGAMRGLPGIGRPLVEATLLRGLVTR